MNLIEELELLFKANNFDDFTKIRYIYLYVCQKFSYDTRFMYAKPDMKKEIYEKELDIKNIEEFQIVCYTYSKILKDILDYFGYKSEVIREQTKNPTPHAYVIVSLGSRKIKLDPTIKHDTTRVKMNVGTYDFRADVDDSTFEDDLRDADETLQEANVNEMSSKRISNRRKLMEYINNIRTTFNGSDSKKNFFDKLNTIFGLVNLKTEFTRYDDIDYYFSYLLKKTRINEPVPTVKPGVFFNVDDKSMQDLINIILVEFGNYPPLFYIMKKEKDNKHYKITQSTPEEVEETMNQYSNYLIDNYFREAVKRAKKSDGYPLVK